MAKKKVKKKASKSAPSSVGKTVKAVERSKKRGAPTSPLRTALEDSSWAVYVHVGPSSDRGWANARTAEGLLPRVRVFRVDDLAELAPWIGSSSGTGIAFGWGTSPLFTLTQAETENSKTVRDTITKSMKP